MPPVEQIKAKRAGTGLRACNHERAFSGFTLFAPQSGGGIVYLIDLGGSVVHTWRMPSAPGNYGYLTERGTLFYNGKTVEVSERFISRQPWKGGVALEADWNGRSGRCVTRTTITTAYDYATVTCCSFAWLSFQGISYQRSRVECRARSTTVRCTAITWSR
jgi:hypothetical protein